MTKLQLLHRALNERMMAAVEQIMEMVGGTVLEYEEETARVRKENEVLKRRLQWMDEGNRANWPGPSELVAHSTPDASNPSQPEESAVSFEFGQESQAVVIKTEFSDHPLYARPVNSLSTLPQNTNQESAIAGTSTDVNYSQTESMTWPSNQSYMEPLEFDPTSSTSIRCRAGRGKRQRMSFACPDCGKVFGREQGLLFHMRTHSKEKPYAYRRRKACFYGDGTRKKKLRGLSQISGENADDLLDENHENANSPSSEHPDEEWEADSPSDNSDQTNNANNPESIASNPVPLQRQRRKKKNKCRCPLCGQRFHKVDDLEFHMKSHMAVAKQSLHNLPSKAQSGRERKKKMRKNVGVVQKTTEASRRLFPCPDCDRVFSRASLLDSHVKSRECEKASLHEQLEEKVPEQTEQPEENTEMVVPEDNGSTEVPSKPKVKKTLHCPHCPKVFSFDGWLRTHIQAAHCEKKISEHFGVLTGIGRTRSQKNQQVKNKKCVIPSIGTHPCQICYKVYSSESYLRKHMNFHLKGNLAVTEQQSKTDAMGNNNGNASGKHSSGNTSEESEGEETIDGSKTIETNQQRSKLQAGTSLQEPKSEQLASQDSCNNSYENDQFGPVLMSHFSLQPRVVLEPIMPKPMYWSTVPSADALKSGRFESSKFDLAQASSSVLVDSEMVMNKQAVYHCTRPVESFGHRNQNKVEAICRVLPKTDIVCVTVGLSQNDSQSDVQNQEHSIIIDEPDETMTQTSTVESLKLTGTTSDCKEISAKKLQTAVSESVFNKTACGVITKMCNPQLLELNLVFSDDEDKMDDVATASKGFDENKTENCSSHGLPNDSQGVIVTDDETAQSMTQTSTVASVRSELITAVENAPKEPGVTKQTKLTMNEKTAVSEAVSKDDVNDAPSPSKGFNEKETVQLDENLCLPNDSQNSETVSIKADDAACSHSKNVDGASQQTDAEDCSNNTQVNIQMSESFGDDSEESEISGKMDSSVPNVKTNESSVKGSEEADMLSNSLATSQSSEGTCKNTKSCTEEKVDCKGGCESLPNQNSGSDSPAQEKSVLEPLRSSNLDFCYSDATDSSKGTREPTPKSESANQSHTDLNIGNDALHESLVQQTDDPQLDDGSSAVNQPHQIPETSCVSDISCSDTQQITDQESDHKTGFSEDLQFFSKPKEKLTLNSSSSQNLDLKSSDDTQQTHGSPDLKLISDPQPERIGSPDPSKGGNWPNSYSDPNSNPSVQDIKPRAVGQIFYLKSNDCDVRESYILAGDGSDEDVETAQNNSSTSATGTTKRKRVNKNVSPKEESSKKRHLSAQSQSFPDKDALSTISVEKAEQVPEHYTNSSYEKSKLYNINYCLYCRKPCYNMISHLQTAHADEPEVAKALNFNKNSNERRQILNLLQTRGNFLHNTNAIQDSEGDADSLRRFAAASLFNDNVYCIYCLGLFSKKSFATHLEQCKSKGPHNAEDSCNEMSSNTGLRSHGPVPVPLHSSVKVDVKLEPSHFSCLNTPYEKLNVTTEKISSPHPDPKTVSTYLTLNHSSTKRVSSTLNSVSFSKANPRNIEVNQLTTECKTEEVCLPLCNADQERELTPVSDTNPITIHPNHSSKWTFEVPPRSPCYDFSPPHNVQTLYNDLGKNSTIAQTCRTGRRGRRRKRRSRFQNQSWGMEDSLSDVNIPDSKVYACHHCTAAFCSPYTLRRHEYTHTGERPFWCNLCNVGFIQKYRLLCHTAKYHGSSLSADHGNRPKRKVHGENKSMTDDANQDQSAVSPGHLSDAVIMNTEEDVASTNQDTDTEMRDEAHLEETSSLLQLENPDTDC